ncbi:MAG: hypothetical protein GY869_23625, partial [Planctomycetes bacterium]|nr:hypothetical protein [Planctomycetota bacterium]
MKNLKLIVLTIAAITFFLSTASMAAIPAEERAALIALYNSTDGDNWTNKSGWKGNNPESDGFSQIGSEDSWYGIILSSDHVAALELSNNGLNGSIPPELGNFNDLYDLKLEYNQLTGSIPPELGNLSGLSHLSLNNNHLSGSIPPELGNIPWLDWLYLENNQLSGSIPSELGNFNILAVLYLNNNQLSGEIPPELGNLSSLEHLDLANNQLTGRIPSELGNAHNLYNLYLNDNYLVGLVPSSITNLVTLRDDNNNFCNNYLYTDDAAVRDFLNQKQEGDDWESCQYATLPTLITMAPDPYYITPNSASGGGNVTYDGGAPVTVRGVCWSESANPTTSDSHTTNGTGSYPGLFASAITELTPNTLYHVRAYATNIVGTAYGDDITFETKTTISAEERDALIALYNSTDGDNWANNSGWKDAPLGPDGFSQTGSEGSWHGVSARDDFGSPNYHVNGLYLGHNNLIGSIPPELANLYSLQYLHLVGNQLTGNIPPEIGNISSLFGLYLNGNQLSGSIPQELKNLPLLVLDLAGNQLTGNIPPELGNIPSLYNLYLNDNFLVGPVPTSITDFVSLGDGVCNFCGNYLYTDDGAVRDFLNQKQSGGDWESCQNRTPPTVTTTDPSSITPYSALGGGNVTHEGGAPVTARGVCWSESPNPTTSDTCTFDRTGLGIFTSSITGLTPSTPYHVRAYAINSVGTGYGNDETFTTPAIPPTVTTTTPYAITPNSALSGGNVTSDGGAPVTERGVCWSESANPTTNDSCTSDGTDLGIFTSSITGLTPKTPYHVRAYATNSIGTGYGEDKAFTTSAIPPSVTTTTPYAITPNSALSGGNVTS